MKAFYTILLLIVSNVFMTFAWYGHLKLQEMKVISNWPLYAVILHFRFRQIVLVLSVMAVLFR